MKKLLLLCILISAGGNLISGAGSKTAGTGTVRKKTGTKTNSLNKKTNSGYRKLKPVAEPANIRELTPEEMEKIKGNDASASQETAPPASVTPEQPIIQTPQNLGKKSGEKNSEWQLVWNDEFDSDRLDETKWSYWENGIPWNSGNYLNEDGELVDQYGFKAKHYYLRDNVRFENGSLIITVKKEDTKTVKINGKDRRILYSSGAVHTKDKYNIRYGKIEMRAAMPQGVGTWPAFWTWPSDYSEAVGSPAKEEIDIFEIYGENLKRVTGTAHALKADNTYASFEGSDLRIRKSEDLTEFNTYAVEWSPEEIRWLFNGRVYKKLSIKKVRKYTENTFKLPHFLMINVAMQNKAGEDGDVKLPTEMKVDYVRVYKKNNIKEINPAR